MRILGAILCGGLSSRFGSDKAMAEVRGLPLIVHVRDALAPQVDALIACGRAMLDLEGVPDRPAPGLGPLGGIAAALATGHARGFDAVLTVPCDTPALPADLARRLAAPGGAAYLASLPVIGLWPAALSPAIDAFLAAGGSRAVRRWAESVDAVAVDPGAAIANVNRPEDLAVFARHPAKPE